jgi:LEM3 (ligand-effect modulator 3) family / CDC50 family
MADAVDAMTPVHRVHSDLQSVVTAEEERPVRCLKFRQQELWAVKPVWSPKCVVVMYYLVAALFIPIGTAVVIMSLTMSQTGRLRYDNVDSCNVGTVGQAVPLSCTMEIVIEKDTGAPSYMYYGLVNYFQNARNYIKNLSAEQLRGKKGPKTSECEKAGAGIDFEADAPVVPCGLAAYSRFNDTFRLCRDRDCLDEVLLSKDGIAWDIDRKKRFKGGEVGTSDGYTEESNALVEDEDFMVWMRLATYNNFHKLYRIIEEPLPKGTYYVRVSAAYPVEQFSGQKFFFISETRWFGGRSRFLGFAYIAVGGISFVAATLILIRAGSAPTTELPPETAIPLEGYGGQQQDSSSAVMSASPTAPRSRVGHVDGSPGDGGDSFQTPRTRPV